MTFAVILWSRKRELRQTTPKEIGRIRVSNRVIADTLSKFCAKNSQHWDVYLPLVAFVQNITVHRTKGAFFGRQAQNPIDLFVPKPQGDPSLMLGENAEELNEQLHEIHREANLPCEPNKDDEETISIKKYFANRLKKETQFGCCDITGQNPESSFRLWTVLLRFWAERVRSSTWLARAEIKNAKKCILTVWNLIEETLSYSSPFEIKIDAIQFLKKFRTT